jgi:hypothetical protein
MYLAYYVHLVGVKGVIGKGLEVFQSIGVASKIVRAKTEQVTYRRQDSIRRHRTKFGLSRRPGARDFLQPCLRLHSYII